MKNLMLFVGVATILFILQSCVDCEPYLAQEYPIKVSYRDEVTGNSLLNGDENLEGNVQMYDADTDSIYFEIFENQLEITSLLILPFYRGNISVDNEQHSVFFIKYYDDVDTVKMVSYFEREDCGYNLKYFDLYVNEKLIQQDENNIYSILK